jgi:hypothetical protein
MSMKRKLARIRASDEQGPLMDLYAELSETELRKAGELLEKTLAERLITGYKADWFREMRQLHIQFLSFAALKNELEDLRNMKRKRLDLSGLSGEKDWSPISEKKAHITEEIAKAFFATAWIDAMEERHITFPGQNVYDIMPDVIPSSARQAAKKLVASMERVNKLPIDEIYDEALRKEELLDAPDIRDKFGYLTAMKAMGSGVSWEDDYLSRGFKVPYYEFTWIDLDEKDLHLEDYE